MVYFDHAATTPIAEPVILAMHEAEAAYGNPSSLHAEGYRAKSLMNTAKRQIAANIPLLGTGVSDTEIIFTSGATEGNNYCIKMAAFAVAMDQRIRCAHEICHQHFVTTAIEHPSVLMSFRFLEALGAVVTYIAPNADGIVSASDVLSAVRDNTVLVSVMAANNELGTIQPIKEIGQGLAKVHNCFGRKVLFHTDAVQLFGHQTIPVKDYKIDLLTVSAHKFYGPKGVGFLYQRMEVVLPPLLSGGGQEEGHRSGTEAVAAICGMVAAVNLAALEMKERHAKELSMKQHLLTKLQEQIGDGLVVNGSMEQCLPGVLNLSFVPKTSMNSSVGGDALIAWLDLNEVQVSTGSACAAGKKEPSHVLLAIGCDRERADRSIRISIGRENTMEQIEVAAEKFIQLYQKFFIA